MKRITTLFAVLIFVSVLFAQTPCNLRLEGHLLYAEDSTSAENAEIFIENLHIKTKTDKFGYFQLKKICQGNTLLEIDLLDGTHIHHSLSLRSDTQITVYIPRPALLLQTAKITTKKPNQPAISADQLTQNAGDNLAAQLQQLPGIQTLKTGNTVGKPISEGMSGLRLPVFVNGIKQEGQQWGPEHGPELDALGYQKMSIISGAHILTRSHDALGGIVEITGNKEAHDGELDITAGSAFASNGKQFTEWIKATGNPNGKKYTWFTNASMRRSGNYSAPEYYLLNTGLSEYSFYGGWMRSQNQITRVLDISYYHNISGIFSGSKIGNIADLKAAIQRGYPLYGEGNFSYQIGAPKQSVAHAQLRYEENKTNQKFLAAVQYDNRREYDFHRSSSQQFPQLDLYQTNILVKKDYNTAFLKHPFLQWGWSSSQTVNRYGGYFFIPDFLGSSTGIYALAQHKINQWQFYYSARADAKFIHSEWTEKGLPLSDNRTFGNMAGAVEMIKNRKKDRLSFNLMRMWRAPWVNELYSKGVHHGSAAYEMGNSKLKTEQDYKVQMEYTYEGKFLYLYAKYYGHYVVNYINLSPDSTPVLTVRGAFPAYYYKQFDAFFTGVDAELKLHPVNTLELTIKGSFIYGRDLANKVYPAYLPLPFAAITGSYHKKNFSFFIQAYRVWKQPFYTPGSDYLPPPHAYFLLHSGLQVHNLFRAQRIHLFLEANNLLNTSYRNYLDRFRYFADLPGRNFQIKITYNFHHHHEKNTY